MPIPTRETITRNIEDSWQSVVDRIIRFVTDNMSQLVLSKSRIVLVNGDNNNINLLDVLFATVTGPSAGFAITGIGSGSGGKIIVVRNGTAQVLTFKNQHASSSAPNRLITGTGADVVGNIALFVYDDFDSRWVMVAVR